MKVLLQSLNADSREVSTFKLSQGIVAAYTTKDRAKEGKNEDCLAIVEWDDGDAVFMVADGMGGHRGGAEASRLAIQTMLESLKSRKKKQPLREFILKGFDEAHEKIKKLKTGAGTTLSLAELSSSKVRFYNIGDSESWWIGGRGVLKFRNYPHSPVGLAQAAGFLTAEEAIAHEESHLILSALGLSGHRIEISEALPLSALDKVLLTSDGLTSVLFTETILSMTAKNDPLGAMTDLLSAYEENLKTGPKERSDDLSLILFAHKGSAKVAS